MRLFLGLFLFSVLLATGASLSCETCFAVSQDCSGQQQTCSANQDTCITIVTKITVVGRTGYSVVKGCNAKAACDLNYNVPGLDAETTVQCSKAAVSSGSLLLSLLGLLLVKMLL